ncbi:DNA-binding protein [Mycolicibacterium moriokaense]|nr:DNA-binding protein [Mycolicibacterium moriokaense]
MNESGLIRVDGVVILTGRALRTTLSATLTTIRSRRRTGSPNDEYEVLAGEIIAAMAAAGQTDVHSPTISHPVPEQPTVPITQEVADRMNVSLRQARRLAPQLGGKKIGGRWFVDEAALREHIEGRRQ